MNFPCLINAFQLRTPNLLRGVLSLGCPSLGQSNSEEVDHSGIIKNSFLMLWGEGTIYKQMEELQPCSQRQREIFAKLLAEAKKREETRLESESDLESRIEEEFLPKLAQEQGASELIAKAQSLHKELDGVEKALGDLGFACDEDSIRLDYGAPKLLKKALKEAQRSAFKEREKSLRKYDLAILGVWSAESIDDAKKIVEALL